MIESVIYKVHVPKATKLVKQSRSGHSNIQTSGITSTKLPNLIPYQIFRLYGKLGYSGKLRRQELLLDTDKPLIVLYYGI